MNRITFMTVTTHRLLHGDRQPSPLLGADAEDLCLTSWNEQTNFPSRYKRSHSFFHSRYFLWAMFILIMWYG